MLRFIGIFLFVFLSPALFLMDSGVAQGTNVSKNADDDYLQLCAHNRLDCQLTYGRDKPVVAPKESQTSTPSRSYNGGEPLFSGNVGIILVVVLLLVAIGLWLKFGNGGVLLSSGPKEIKPQREVPENWQQNDMSSSDHEVDFLDRLRAMQNRSQAMVELLRHCLLYAATMSDTRLARSDTERSVLKRLPETLHGREQLEYLLYETELAHYGGLLPDEDKFSSVLDNARQFLAQKGRRHA